MFQLCYCPSLRPSASRFLFLGQGVPITAFILGLTLLAFCLTYSDTQRLTSRTSASRFIFPIHPPLA